MKESRNWLVDIKYEEITVGSLIGVKINSRGKILCGMIVGKKLIKKADIDQLL